MSTKLYMKQYQNSFSTSTNYFYASLTASVLTFTTSITNKINGTVQDTATAGGAVLAWISPPVLEAFRLSQTITYNTWALTSSITGAPKTIGRVYRYSGGTETQISTATSSLTQSTTIQNDSFTDVSPISTDILVGDRIAIKWFVSSSSATGTETLDYGGKTGASDGDTWVQFTENIKFSNEAEFIQYVDGGGSTSPQTVTLPGVSATGNLLVIHSTTAPAASTVGISDLKPNTYNSRGSVSWDAGANLESYFDVVNLTGGGAAIAVTQTVSGTPTLNFLAVSEYGGMSPTPFDVASAATAGNSIGPSISTPATNFQNELIVQVGDDGTNHPPITLGAGQVTRTGGSGTFTNGSFSDKVVVTSGIQTMSWTEASGSDPWVSMVLAYKQLSQSNPINMLGHT